MFARKIRAEILELKDPCACPVDWLDSFCMRSFTGRSACDETLPVADGLWEVSFQVGVAALRADMEDWLTRKFGAARQVRLRLAESEPR
jgi:hypothetical protein